MFLKRNCIKVGILQRLRFAYDFCFGFDNQSEIRPFTMTVFVWATHAYEGPCTTPYEHSLVSCVPKSVPWTGYPYAFRCQRTVMYIHVIYKVLCVLMISFLLYKRMFEKNSRI